MPKAAHAQLLVDRLIVDFEPGEPARQDILVQNQSKDRYYITVTPAEVIKPGDDDSKEVIKTNPEELGLLVTPNRMVLDPGTSRSIRVVSLNGPLTSDRIYRVLIEPQIGDMPTEAGTDRTVALKILTAYEALVIARPPRPNPSLVAERTATGLVLKNTGNSNTLLYDGVDCPAAPPAGAKSVCTKIGAHRMYVGNAWHVPLAHPTDQVTFQAQMSESGDPSTVKY
jgi:hypothetical protein